MRLQLEAALAAKDAELKRVVLASEETIKTDSDEEDAGDRTRSSTWHAGKSGRSPEPVEVVKEVQVMVQSPEMLAQMALRESELKEKESELEFAAQMGQTLVEQTETRAIMTPHSTPARTPSTHGPPPPLTAF